MLMIAFLPFSCLGSWMYDEPPVRSYSTRLISRLTTLWNLQLLPLWLKLKIPSSIGSKNILNSSASSLPSRFTAVLVRKCAIIVSVFPLIKPCLTISEFKINLIFVWRFSLISLKTNGFVLCMKSLGPKPCFSLVIVKCLAAPSNALAVCTIWNLGRFLFISLIFFCARLPRDLIFFIFGNRPYDPYPSIQASPLLLWFPLSAFLILISGTLMYLFSLKTGLAKSVGIGSSRIPAAVLFLFLCSASLKDLRVPARSSLWDPFSINRQKNKVLKALVKFFQSRNVEWKNSECGWVRVFGTDPWKSWAGPGHTPNLVNFFSVHTVERKFHGRDAAFGRNQGMVGPESIPRTFH